MSINFDRCADTFDARPNLPDSLMSELLDTLVRHLRRADFVLDLGTGTGRFLIPFQGRGIRLVGTDISPRMIERARRKGGQDVLVANAMALPFRDGAFEATLAVSVLHLVPSLRQAINEVARVTRKRLVAVSEIRRLYQLPRPAESEIPYDPLNRYLDLAGPPWRDYTHPQHRWTDIVEKVAPESSVKLGPAIQLIEGDDLLRLLSTRAYSPQWPVPEPIHTAAIQRISDEMAGRRYEEVSEVRVVTWTSDALRTM